MNPLLSRSVSPQDSPNWLDSWQGCFQHGNPQPLSGPCGRDEQHLGGIERQVFPIDEPRAAPKIFDIRKKQRRTFASFDHFMTDLQQRHPTLEIHGAFTKRFSSLDPSLLPLLHEFMEVALSVEGAPQSTAFVTALFRYRKQLHRYLERQFSRSWTGTEDTLRLMCQPGLPGLLKAITCLFHNKGMPRRKDIDNLLRWSTLDETCGPDMRLLRHITHTFNGKGMPRQEDVQALRDLWVIAFRQKDPTPPESPTPFRPQQDGRERWEFMHPEWRALSELGNPFTWEPREHLSPHLLLAPQASRDEPDPDLTLTDPSG